MVGVFLSAALRRSKQKGRLKQRLGSWCGARGSANIAKL
jgi:hypothetical protein